MTFDVRLISEEFGTPLGRGRMTIGTFAEEFEIAFGYWSAAQYVEQWRNGALRIIRGFLSSCLLTSVTNPTTANFLFCWPMYRFGNHICIQNRVLFLDQLSEPFDINNPYASIRPRETISERGSPISEWQTTIEELVTWLNSDPSMKQP